MAMDRPPHLFDKEIRKAAGLARTAREELLRKGPELASTVNPLEDERVVSTRAAFLELGEHTGDPLFASMRTWVYALTLERVLWPDTVRLASAWHAVSLELNEPEPARLSPHAVLERVLSDRAPVRRRAWAEALARGARDVTSAAVILAERRVEAIRLLGVTAPDAIEIPSDPPEAVGDVAAGLLKKTETMASADLREPRWEEAIARAMARGATSGWPAKLSARWIEEELRPTRLTEGLSIDLGPLPALLGASSFVRTLARFGRVFAEASAPPSAPFSMAHPPFDLRVARRAALFGSLLSDPVFGMRALGLGRDRAREQAREIARASLLSLRLSAARVRLRGALVLPAKQRADRFEEETALALGAPVPGALAGVVPRLSPGDATELAGAVLAAQDLRDLVERFDEDWFRSPHAAEAIRGEQSVLPAEARTTAAALEKGLAALVRTLEERIG